MEPIPTVSLTRANRLASTEDKARAWDALMSSSSDTTTAVQHATDVLCDVVTYRLRMLDTELAALRRGAR